MMGGGGSSSIRFKWTRLADVPLTSSSRQMEILDGILYLIGGGSGTYYDTPISTIDRYDIASNTWLSKIYLPLALLRPGAFVYNNDLYVSGGKGTNPKVLLKLLKSNNTFQTLPNAPFMQYGSVCRCVDV